MASPIHNRTSMSKPQQCSDTKLHTEDTYCELVIGILQHPIRLRFQTRSNNNVSVLSFPKVDNTEDVLQRPEDEKRPQQRQPLLPPVACPSPTCLPITELCKTSTHPTLPHDIAITAHIEDTYCQLVVISLKLPTIRPEVQPFHVQPDLKHNLNVVKASGVQLLQKQENRTRSQQKQPLLPSVPRSTYLPIPLPPSELHKSTASTIEDPHCELVIAESLQPPTVRLRVHTQHDWTHKLSELLKKQHNKIKIEDNTIKLLHSQKDKTRPQQRQPLLPPEPRPTRLPIPKPPPPSPSSNDDLHLSIITVSSGYGSLTRSTEQSFLYDDDDDDDDDIKNDCDFTSEDWVMPPTSSH